MSLLKEVKKTRISPFYIGSKNGRGSIFVKSTNSWPTIGEADKGDNHYCPYKGHGLFTKFGPINENRFVDNGVSEIYQGDNKIFKRRVIEKNAFVIDAEKRYYCDGTAFWNGKLMREANEKGQKELLNSLGKELEALNKKVVKCLWCSKSVPYGESVSIHDPTGTIPCFTVNDEDAGVMAALGPFCSQKCSEEYRKSVCQRNGYKSTK